jgi:hypothetical protein
MKTKTNKGNKTTKKTTTKKGLGEPQQKGVTITFERVALYGLGILTIGTVFWFAKRQLEALTQQQANNNNKDTKPDPAQASVVALPTGGGTTPSGGGTPAGGGANIEVEIPPISQNRNWGGVIAEVDEFPLSMGKGGLRVEAVHRAWQKKGLITKPTGYFGKVTQGLALRELGKVTISKEDFIKIMKDAGMTRLEGVHEESSVFALMGI